MAPSAERRLLQIAIAIAGIVPVGAGLWGIGGGVAPGATDSSEQVRYLSGLLLGIGLAFWSTIPTIERRGEVVRILALIVVAGGLARLVASLSKTHFPIAAAAPLVMELVVTPALALWREKVEQSTPTKVSTDEQKRKSSHSISY